MATSKQIALQISRVNNKIEKLKETITELREQKVTLSAALKKQKSWKKP